MARTAEQERLCELSGRVTSSDPLVALLYTLMRDHLPTGEMAAITPAVAETIIATGGDPLAALYCHLCRGRIAMPVLEQLIQDASVTRECEYTNGWLARYAQHLAATMRGVGPVCPVPEREG